MKKTPKRWELEHSSFIELNFFVVNSLFTQPDVQILLRGQKSLNLAQLTLRVSPHQCFNISQSRRNVAAAENKNFVHLSGRKKQETEVRGWGGVSF